MTSVSTSYKQPHSSYVNLATLTGTVYSLASVQAALADKTGATAPAAVAWDTAGALTGAAGTVFLRDLGKTLTDGTNFFRKVQLIGTDPSTSGVSGDDTAADPYLTGYILLGLNGAKGSYGSNKVTPVAKYGL
jgi:hypothetical protein